MNKVDNREESEGLKGRYIYILSPVRYATTDQKLVIQEYAEKLKLAGAKLFNPADDAPQEDATGYNIVMAELNFLHEAAKNGGRVDILWNAGGKPSEGSRVDIGIAVALGLELNLVEIFNAEAPTGPQVCFKYLDGVVEEWWMMDNLVKKILRGKSVEIDWDTEMTGEKQEWQRILLGMALGKMAIDSDFKIKLRTVVGIDPPEMKSYVKVMKEIEARQSISA